MGIERKEVLKLSVIKNAIKKSLKWVVMLLFLYFKLTVTFEITDSNYSFQIS